jgi:hypothetical protein
MLNAIYFLCIEFCVSCVNCSFSFLEILDGTSRRYSKSNPYLLQSVFTFWVNECFSKKLLKQGPSKKELESNFLLSKQPLKAKVTLPTMGVVLTSLQLPIIVDIDNSTRKPVDKMRTIIRQIVTIKGLDPLKNEQIQVLKNVVFEGVVQDSKVDGGCKYNREILIDIPENLQPNVRHGKLVKKNNSYFCF